jgi:hypothetical protein
MNQRFPTRLPVAVGVGAILAATAAAIGLGHSASLNVTSQGLASTRTCTLSATTSLSTVVADNYVRQNTGNGNNGLATETQVGGASSQVRRAFVRFDLTRCNPVIPATATVKLARLRLVLSAAPVATRTYSASRVVAPCPEGLSTCWGQLTQTWNNQPATAPPTDTITVTGGQALGYCTWTVTADVQSFIAGAASNYGWAIRDGAEGTSGDVARFAARDLNMVAAAPQLVITYKP